MSENHTKKNLSKLNGKSGLHHIIQEWEDDMKKWPHITYKDIFNYLILSVCVDGSEMRSYKSTDAYQYLHSGKVGWVFIHFEDDNLVFLKADVQPSQTKTHHHSAWILVSSVGTVETAGCSCCKGRGSLAVMQLQYYGK